MTAASGSFSSWWSDQLPIQHWLEVEEMEWKQEELWPTLATGEVEEMRLCREGHRIQDRVITWMDQTLIHQECEVV